MGPEPGTSRQEAVEKAQLDPLSSLLSGSPSGMILLAVPFHVLPLRAWVDKQTTKTAVAPACPSAPPSPAEASCFAPAVPRNRPAVTQHHST